MEGETIVGYFHLAATPNFPEGAYGEQPIYYNDKEVGVIEYRPDGRGHIKMKLKDQKGKETDLGEEHDRTKDELG
ncbi:hypothetical protein CHISP_0967 [Chitinispirillum alkaliphilum]|nr:hypothetical protein CHISP_0967 [Chitinispirillum alkaliphilum]